MRDLELILDGPDAAGAISDLTAALEIADPTLTPRPLDTAWTEPKRAVDPVAVAALALSIPGAILAALDLADRIGKRRKATALIETAARVRIERRVEVLTITAEGTKPLAELDADTLLELVEGDEQGRQ